jgi:hypothetical protein
MASMLERSLSKRQLTRKELPMQQVWDLYECSVWIEAETEFRLYKKWLEVVYQRPYYRMVTALNT